MKVTILVTPNTPADRDIEYLQRRLQESLMSVEIMDADSRTGIALCQLYDLMDRPAVVVTDDDGTFIQSWQGQLPSAEEVGAYYGSAA